MKRLLFVGMALGLLIFLIAGSTSVAVVQAVDLDGDAVEDDLDNCPGLSNPDQADTDVDGLGDACDPDDDGDGVVDGDDQCAATPSDFEADPANGCHDFDNDLVFYPGDNCPTTPNPSGVDTDRDGLGDACDPDDDGDGVVDGDDRCAATPSDFDADPANGCHDFDNDLVFYPGDNCPTTFNPDGADADGDGIGDACDSPTPSDKDDCRNGGWRNLYRADGTPFKNQGDCIQYANTGK
jgi:hypothetical protein